MSIAPAKFARLADRGVVAIRGADTRAFLQGLVTNDMDRLDKQPAIHAGLLSPQGKILFEFLVVMTAGGCLLDVPRAAAAELVKRLGLYKLRARVDIADVSEGYEVVALWDMPEPRALTAGYYADPRLPALGYRGILERPAGAHSTADVPGGLLAGDYSAHRISLGVPESGLDYTLGDAFPHEALFDQLHGVSFTKGCYVGQEVVSRMQHRGTARSRIVPVAGDGHLSAGTSIDAGETHIGRMGSVAGTTGLAIVRLDRAAEAIAAGRALLAGPVAITLRQPPWATFVVPGLVVVPGAKE